MRKLSLIGALLLSACGEDGLRPLTPFDSPGGFGGAVPTDLQTVDALCSGATEQRVLTLRFNNPATPCDWAQDENVTMIDGYITARREQNIELDLPSGALVCDVDFEFERQEFWYDDHFLLNFNDVTLTASFDFSEWLEDQGIWKWDWRAIRGIQWHSLDQPLDTTYCPGEADGFSRCEIPETDTQGAIELELDSTIIRSIMALNVGRSTHQMSFITTGDDNPGTDCQHDPVEMSLNVTYANR